MKQKKQLTTFSVSLKFRGGFIIIYLDAVDIMDCRNKLNKLHWNIDKVNIKEANYPNKSFQASDEVPVTWFQRLKNKFWFNPLA